MIRTRLQSFTTAHAVLFLGLLIIGLLSDPAVSASNASGTFAAMDTILQKL